MAESPMSVRLIQRWISSKNAGHNKMEPDCNGQVCVPENWIILESCRVSDYKHTRLDSVCGVRG